MHPGANRTGKAISLSWKWRALLTEMQNNMNTRANIMYFIEPFLDIAQREGHPDYIRMMQRDIIRVVDAVAPDDGSGAANVKVVRKVSIRVSLPRIRSSLHEAGAGGNAEQGLS